MTLHISLGANFFRSGACDVLVQILERHAPDWYQGLYIEGIGKKHPVDLKRSSAVSEMLFQISTKAGPLYHTLMERSGRANSRVFGRGALRGSDTSLYVVAQHDEHILTRVQKMGVLFGNWLTISAHRKKINGLPVAQWAEQVMAEICAQMEVWHAHAEMKEQYDAKNMLLDHGMRAVGLDASKALPGLYWLNFFGQPYRDFIGEEKLLNAPGHKARKVDHGILLRVHPDPTAWSSPEYLAKERAVLDHIGEQYFFNKQRGFSGTLAPDFSATIQQPD